MKRKLTADNGNQEGKENLPERHSSKSADEATSHLAPSRPRKRRKVSPQQEQLPSVATQPQAGPSTGVQRCRLGGGQCEYQLTKNFDQDWDHLKMEHGDRNDDNLFACTYPGCAGYPSKDTSGYEKKQSLNRHVMSVHWTGEVRCHWPGCDKVYPRKDQVTTHIRRFHEKIPAATGIKKAPKRTKK